jgi:hypothetical protein
VFFIFCVVASESYIHFLLISIKMTEFGKRGIKVTTKNDEQFPIKFITLHRYSNIKRNIFT